MNAEESKRGNRWFLCTWNNPDPAYLEILKATGAKYGRGQLEKGSQGTVHVQFVLFFSDNLSHRKVKNILPKEIHFKGKPGSAKKDICNYVWKDDETTIPDTRFEWGKAQSITKRVHEKYDEAIERCRAQNALEVDPEILVKHLMNLLRLEAIYASPTESVECRGIWYFGKPGVGKSHAARSLYQSSMYIKSQNKWFDGYRGERAILLDDLDSSAMGHLLKIWADKWPCFGEIKGGTVALRHERFIVTSNYLPRDLWKEDKQLRDAIQRRFLFVHIFFRGEDRITEAGDAFGELPDSIDGPEVNMLQYLPGLFI